MRARAGYVLPSPFERQGDELVLLAEKVDGGHVVGEVGLVWLGEPVQTAEVGYVFNPAFGGQGLATEAVRAVIDLAFERCGFKRVIARTDADNSASRALCERLGMGLLDISTSTNVRGVHECTYELRNIDRLHREESP